MASPAVTYTFSNSTTADATEMNQNFLDVINGITDGSKDLSIFALTCAGNVSLNANVTLGNASGDDITFTGSLASSIPIKTHNSFDIGSVTTLGLRAIYFASSSATKTAKLQGPAISSDVTVTLPAITGTVRLYTMPTVQVLSSASDTYTTPANVKYLRIRMVGGGGGGASGGSGTPNAGTTGGDTTWKTAGGAAFVTASGGVGGPTSGPGGAGGAASIGGAAISILALQGGYGGPGQNTSAIAFYCAGGNGGSSYFGGAGGGTAYSSSPTQGIDGTGGGGGGAGIDSATGQYSGSGGGAGGYCEFYISGPSATYDYTVGAGGAGGTAGGRAGGDGGNGTIIVEEHYG